MKIVEAYGETPAFEVLRPPVQTVPFVFNSPHSGRTYLASFLKASRLDRQTIRRSEDSFVDEFFLGTVELGALFLSANFPRAFLDVNREPYELDPAMFIGRLPDYANSASARVAGGLGTIARVVADAEEIYRQPLPVSEAIDRIERYYKPYHEALRSALAETHNSFGCAVLIDCHSMPSTGRGIDGRSKPDMILGDRYATSCASRLTDCASAILRDLGYRVGRNRPYAGGFITERYGRPSQGVHVLQLEINRALYMHEGTNQKTLGFDALAADLLAFARRLTRMAPVEFGVTALAAE